MTLKLTPQIIIAKASTREGCNRPQTIFANIPEKDVAYMTSKRREVAAKKPKKSNLMDKLAFNRLDLIKVDANTNARNRRLDEKERNSILLRFRIKSFLKRRLMAKISVNNVIVKKENPFKSHIATHIRERTDGMLSTKPKSKLSTHKKISTSLNDGSLNNEE